MIFNSLFENIDEKKQLNPNQSVFLSFDFCVNQLLCINHDISENCYYDSSKDTRAVFLDISKAFDKMWIPGFRFKFKSFGISGDLLELIKKLLSNRFQRVVLIGQISEWEAQEAQGQISSTRSDFIKAVYK